MGFLARRLIKQDLTNVEVLVNDTGNDYFNLVEVPTTFTQGRSAFKIFGSRLLKKGVRLKMEMLDAAGNTVFISPVDLVGEEQAPFLPYRFVTVEVYRPPVNKEGIGTLTILGEIDPQAVNFQIPSRFQNTYNVKYEQKINLDLSTSVNTQPIRFFKSPFIQASEIVKPRIVITPVTQSTQFFASGSATTSPDLKNQSFTVTTGSQEKEDNVTPYRPTKDIEKFTEKFKYKTGLYGGAPPIIKRRGGQVFFASKEDPPQAITIPQGNLSSKMTGGTVTIPVHTSTIQKIDGEGRTFNEEVTVPEFQTQVKEVINDSQLVLDDVVTFDDPDKVDHKIVDDFTDVPLTMSFEDADVAIISSSKHNDSFLNLTIKNLRTFSGDVYRVKIHGKMQSQNSGFSTLADTVIESPELLRDDTSISGFLRTGYFLDQNHINTYWTASSFDSNVKAANVAMTHTGSQYIDSLHLSGSTSGVNQSIVAETHPDYPFILEKDIIYTLSAKIKGTNTTKVNQDGINENGGKLYFHLSGSNLNGSKKLNTNTFLGAELSDNESGNVVSLDLNSETNGIQDFNRVEHSFQPLFNLDTLRNIDTTLQIRATSGEWHISDLSLRPAQDTGFSPDEYNIIVPLPRTQRPDKLDLFIEYFDINSNTVETLTTAENVDISGSAFVIDGLDNLLTGSLFMGNVAGEGIEAAGVNSAFIRTVGYQGFKSASAGEGGGFMMFSGSVLPNAPDNYTGAGLEIHDGVTGADESFLRFRTNPSILDIKTKTFFLGSETAGNFISGSNGLIEITSSNFHLQPDGDVVLQGTITAEAGGTIGGFTINANDLTGGTGGSTIKLASGTGIHLGDASLASAPFSVTNAGVLKAESGTIGGWTLGATSFTGGEMTITSTGTIESNQFATDVAGSGFRLTADDGGFLEVENARIRGTLKTAVFEKETVNAVGGQLYVANSTVLTGSAVAPGGIHTAAQTTMSVENVSGFVADEILSIKKVSQTGFGTEYVKVVSASRNDSSSETDLGGLLFVERGFGNGVSGDSGSLGDIAGAAQSYSGSQVVVSTGKPPNTGYIRLNANPNDFTTPYMDVVERTGSGIYDVDLKVRLGDLSGLSSARLSEVSAPGDPGFGLYTDNVFLKGAITATTGSIGGINMQSSKIFTGAGVFSGSSTGFFADSSGRFSLKNKVSYDDTTSNLVLNPDTFDLNTSNFRVSSSNNGIIAFGSTLPTDATSEGIFMKGDGTFNFQKGSSYLRGTSSGLEISYPSFSVDTGGIIQAQGASIAGTITAESGEIGSGSFRWQIDGDKIINSAESNFAVEMNAGEGTEGFFLTSGSKQAQIVPEFTPSAQVLGGGGSNTFNFTGGTEGSTYGQEIVVGHNSSAQTSASFGYNNGATTFTVGSSDPNNGNTLSSGTKYKSTAVIGLKSLVSLSNGGEVAGNVTVTGNIQLINNDDSDAVIETHTIDTTLPHDFLTVKTANITVNTIHTPSSNHKYYWKLNSLTVTNNNLIEEYVLGGKTLTNNLNNTFDVFFKQSLHTPQNNLTEMAPGGFQAVFLSDSTLETSPNAYFKVDGSVSNQVDILGEATITGSLIVKTRGSTPKTTIAGGTLTSTQTITGNKLVSSNEVEVAADDGIEFGTVAEIHHASSLLKFFAGDQSTLDMTLSDAGALSTRGDITAFATSITSDKRFKTNIIPITNSLDKIKKLKGVEFDWYKEYDGEGHDIGFIAQEVREVSGLESLVKESENLRLGDKSLNVSYSKLIPVLVEAIKEQQKQIDDLKKKLEES